MFSDYQTQFAWQVCFPKLHLTRARCRPEDWQNPNDVFHYLISFPESLGVAPAADRFSSSPTKEKFRERFRKDENPTNYLTGHQCRLLKGNACATRLPLQAVLLWR
jgi:hypothetical protein